MAKVDTLTALASTQMQLAEEIAVAVDPTGEIDVKLLRKLHGHKLR